jgi:phosphate transport system substrate-binding protein
MSVVSRVLAALAALFWCIPASAQDVTLVSREGGIVLSGSLQGYDGEFYSISTSYGMLTVEGESVICEGPACPDLIAPRADIRITGASDVSAALLRPLFQAFAETRGLAYEDRPGDAYTAVLLDPATRKELANISFQPLEPTLATAALADGQADLKLSFQPEDGFGSHALAMDALAAIVAPDNPTPEISTIELAQVLSGEVKNWSQIGGPDMPVVLHALRPETDMQQALSARLGAPVAAEVLHADQASLATAVARDPWAIAIIGRANIGPARRIPLTDSCGFPLLPTPLAVKAEDYPLALPVLILTPKRRLPLMTRDFLDFLRTPAAQAVILAGGYMASA